MKPLNWQSFLIGVIAGVGSFAAGSFLVQNALGPQENSLISPLLPSPTPKPLLQYSFSNLASYSPEKSRIELKEVMFTEPELTAYLGIFQTGGKTMSMQIMVPNTATPSAGFPVILMNRGYADHDIYQTGVGTKNGARYFARSGFVTVAPDFLGYGVSDQPPVDTIAARLERPKQVLDLLSSLATLKMVNPDKIGIWGHSNGGQISLSILEITGKNYPTVLWAPVTKPFPYSILYFTDSSPDEGKELRRVVASFEKDYDILDFTIGRKLDRITAPIQLHQGTNDDAVPYEWSRSFADKLETNQKDIEYYQYSGADHNLQPAWNIVAQRSLAFFVKHLYGE